MGTSGVLGAAGGQRRLPGNGRRKQKGVGPASRFYSIDIPSHPTIVTVLVLLARAKAIQSGFSGESSV